MPWNDPLFSSEATEEKQENQQRSSGKPGAAVFSFFLFPFYL